MTEGEQRADKQRGIPPARNARAPDGGEQLPSQEDMIAGVLGELQRHARSLGRVMRGAAKRASGTDKGADDARDK